MSTWQRTKIVCTLGPATDRPGILHELMRRGMDVARINMSHGSHADHAARIERVRAASQALAVPIAILADLPGPKFRIGTLEGGSRKLEDGMTVCLAAAAEDLGCLPVRNRELLRALRPEESVFLADGSVELRVKAAAPDRVECEVTAGGTVRSGSGINVPESELPALIPTEEDRRHLAFATSQAVDWIGVSFVQAADDVERVRACIGGGHPPLFMAKIEKRQALKNLDAIVAAADGVMVARGDLGVETDLAEIPLAQKRIIAAANASRRPVVTATQMLESMVEHEHPTRAEVADVANAVLDGTDAVMLSAESAIGKHPAAAVSVLRRVLNAIEGGYPNHMPSPQHATIGGSAEEAVAFAACQLAEILGAKAIVVRVRDHSIAGSLARHRPTAPIVALSTSAALCRSLVMLRGVAPLEMPAAAGPPRWIERARDWLFDSALAQPGDQVIVLSAAADSGPLADTIRVAQLRADTASGG